MRGLWLAVAVLSVWAAPARTTLEIRNIQAAYGQVGPVRPSADYYPGDEIFFRFLIAGARLDAAGKISCDLVLTFTGPGDTVLLNKTFPIESIYPLGGDSVPGSARVTLGGDVPPGAYALTVTLRDKVASTQVKFQRAITVRSAAFAIVALRFSYDADGKAHRPGRRAGRADAVFQAEGHRIRPLAGQDRPAAGRPDPRPPDPARDQRTGAVR